MGQQRPQHATGDAARGRLLDAGTEGGDGTTYNSGHTYEFTFEVPGTYDYYCARHRSIGMTGSVVVE